MSTMDMLEYTATHHDKAGFTTNVIETDDYLYFRYRFGVHRFNSAVYDKKSKKIKHGKEINDICGVPVRFLGHRDNILIGCIDDLSKLEFTDKAAAFISPELLEQLKKIDVYANCLLVEIELKDIE